MKTHKKVKFFLAFLLIAIVAGGILWFAMQTMLGSSLTAYNSVSWSGIYLSYSSIIQANDLGQKTDSLTSNHVYVKYSGSPYFGFMAVQPDCTGTDYPCTIESLPDYVYPPTEVVSQYKSADAFSDAYTCKISGTVKEMYRYIDGGADDVHIGFLYNYYLDGGKVSWEGSQRGFSCVFNDLSNITSSLNKEWCKVKNSQYTQYLVGCESFTPVIQGTVEFYPKSESQKLNETTDDIIPGSIENPEIIMIVAAIVIVLIGLFIFFNRIKIFKSK